MKRGHVQKAFDLARKRYQERFVEDVPADMIPAGVAVDIRKHAEKCRLEKRVQRAERAVIGAAIGYHNEDTQPLINGELIMNWRKRLMAATKELLAARKALKKARRCT